MARPNHTLPKRTAIIFIVGLLLFGQVHAQGPSFLWVKHFESDNFSSSCSPNSMITDASGGAIILGNFKGIVDFDGGPGVFNLDAGGSHVTFIARYDVNGNLVWVHMLNGNAVYSNQGGQTLAADNAGNLFFFGRFRGTVDFDPGPGVYEMTAVTPLNESCLFILSLDSAGQFRWAKKMRDADVIGPRAICVDPLGNVLLTGFFRFNVDFDPGPGLFELSGVHEEGFILKLRNDGTFIWAAAIAGTLNESGVDLVTDLSGNIFLTGPYSMTVDFDPGPAIFNVTAGAFEDVFVLKLRTDGGFDWVKSFGGSGFDRPTAIERDGSGNLLVSGEFDQTADFDPGPGTFPLTSAGGRDGFILKLDPSGNMIWARRFGGTVHDIPGSLAIDPQNNVYMGGAFDGTADFDPGPVTYFLFSKGNYDAFITSLDTDGAFRFARSFGGIRYDAVADILVNGQGEILTTGAFNGTVDFDPGPGVFNITASKTQSNDGFLHKMIICPDASTFQFSAQACNSYTLNGQEYTATGVYMQTLQNAARCDSIILLDLTVFPTKLTTVDASICEGGSLFVGGANQTTAGTYYDTLVSHQGCDSIITTNLSITPQPVPNLGADKSFCLGQPVTLDPGNYSGYVWHDLSTSPTFTATGTGSYWVTVTDGNNCTATDTIHFTGVVDPPRDFLKATDSICNYGTLEVIAPAGFTDYLWSTGSATVTTTIQSPGEYTLRVIDGNGCYGLDTIIVHQRKCLSGIIFPNAFTPNNDNLNDFFGARVFEPLVSFRLEIYDRNGQRVFMTSNPNQGWDGTLNGKILTSAVFVWQCTYQLTGSPPAFQKGIVAVIR